MTTNNKMKMSTSLHAFFDEVDAHLEGVGVTVPTRRYVPDETRYSATVSAAIESLTDEQQVELYYWLEFMHVHGLENNAKTRRAICYGRIHDSPPNTNNFETNFPTLKGCDVPNSKKAMCEVFSGVASDQVVTKYREMLTELAAGKSLSAGSFRRYNTHYADDAGNIWPRTHIDGAKCQSFISRVKHITLNSKISKLNSTRLDNPFTSYNVEVDAKNIKVPGKTYIEVINTKGKSAVAAGYTKGEHFTTVPNKANVPCLVKGVYLTATSIFNNEGRLYSYCPTGVAANLIRDEAISSYFIHLLVNGIQTKLPDNGYYKSTRVGKFYAHIPTHKTVETCVADDFYYIRFWHNNRLVTYRNNVSKTKLGLVTNCARDMEYTPDACGAMNQVFPEERLKEYCARCNRKTWSGFECEAPEVEEQDADNNDEFVVVEVEDDVDHDKQKESETVPANVRANKSCSSGSVGKVEKPVVAARPKAIKTMLREADKPCKVPINLLGSVGNVPVLRDGNKVGHVCASDQPDCAYVFDGVIYVEAEECGTYQERVGPCVLGVGGEYSLDVQDWWNRGYSEDWVSFIKDGQEYYIEGAHFAPICAIFSSARGVIEQHPKSSVFRRNLAKHYQECYKYFHDEEIVEED
jgi:hypothetical protein